MPEYLKMENATLELDFSNRDEYIDFFRKNRFFILRLKFQRIQLTCEEKDLEILYHYLSRNFEDKILILINCKLNKEPALKWNDYIIIINTNEEMLFNNEYIVNKFYLTSENIDEKITNINNVENKILSLNVDINNLNDFNNNLIKIIENLNDVGLEGFYVSSSLMKEHPCNAYLCDGWKCGKKISCLPKHIYIDNSYNIYPHKIVNNKLHLGNYKNSNLKDIFCNMKNTEGYKKFMEYNKRVFIKYLANYPYQLFPLEEFIKFEVENDK